MTAKRSQGRRDLVISFDFPPEIGGAHKWLYEVYRRWPAQVDVLTHRYPLADDAAASALRFDSVGHGSLRIFRQVGHYGDLSVLNPRLAQVLWQCRRRAQDTSHAGALRLHALRAFPEGFAGYVVQRTRRASTQLVTYAHGEELLVAQSSRQLMHMARLAYRHSSVVIANSENTRRAVLELVPEAKTAVIHPGVDCASFCGHADAARCLRSEFGWPASTVVVLTLGRMEPRKNHAGVMRAISQLRRKGLEIGYICAGTGPDRGALAALAQSLGMQPWVRFPGAVDERNKASWFAAADIFAMPSVRIGAMIEGFGIVFLEAAAAGVPVVCGNSGGQPEAVQDGVTGMVMDGTNVGEIERAIEALAVDTTRRTQMGDAAREWARQHDWEDIVRATVKTVGAVDF